MKKKIKIKRDKFQLDPDQEVNKKNLRSLENRSKIMVEVIKKRKPFK